MNLVCALNGLLQILKLEVCFTACGKNDGLTASDQFTRLNRLRGKFNGHNNGAVAVSMNEITL